MASAQTASVNAGCGCRRTRQTNTANANGSSSRGANPMNKPLYQRTLLQVTEPRT